MSTLIAILGGRMLGSSVRRSGHAKYTRWIWALALAFAFTLIAAAPASAADTGYLSGRVTDEASGQPLASAWVTVSRDIGVGQWEYVTSVASDASGMWSLGGLPAGSYRVSFTSYFNTHVYEYYNNTRDWNAATSIVLGEGQALIGIDAALEKTSAIEGRITSAETSAPVTNASIRLYQSNVSGQWWVSQEHFSAVDASGAFRLSGLDPGTYRIEFVPPSSGVGSQYAPEFFSESIAVGTAADVVLTPGSTVGGVNGTLGPAGYIEGVVTDASTGEPIADAGVQAARPSGTGWSYSNSVQTDAQGRYRIGGLAAGNYRVRVWASGAYTEAWYGGAASLSAATDVAVVTGETTAGIDLALTAAGRLSGRVTDAITGEPILYPTVTVYKRTIRPWSTPSVTWTRVSSGSYGSSEGTYEVGGLAAGVYRIEITDGIRASCFFPDASSIDAAQDLVISAGQRISGLDVALKPANTITGRVTGEASVFATGAPVTITAWQMRAGLWTSVKSVAADADGSYEMPGLSDGDYRIQFRPTVSAGTTSGPAGQYYPAAASIESAHDISVQGGTTVSGIDAYLGVGGAVSGRVIVDNTGDPLSGIRVFAYVRRGNTLVSVTPQVSTTDASGNYTLAGLPEGSYWIMFRDVYNNAYAQDYYPGTATVDTAQQVSVTAGQVTSGIDCAMQPSARVTGAVRDSLGDPVAGVSVQALVGQFGEWTARRSVTTDGSGRYSLDGLRAGEYRIAFADSSGVTTATAFWQSASTIADADPVTVDKAQTREGIDGVLDINTFRRIAGTVSDSSGTPLEQIEVTLYRLDPQTSEWKSLRVASTGPDGRYAFKRLDPGSYKVGFRSLSGAHQARFFGPAASLESAAPITLDPEFRGSADVTLLAFPEMSGRVVDSSGAALSGVTVDVFRLSGSSSTKVGTAITDADGRYAFHKLAIGTYLVLFTDSQNRYVTQYFGAATEPQGASTIGLGMDDVKSDVDVVMVAKAVMRGRLTDMSSGAGVAGVTVTAGRLQGGAWTDMGSVTTTGSGGYEMRVPAGTYRFRFSDPQSRFVTMMHAGIVSGSFVDPRALDVVVGEGEVRSDLDDVLAPYGHIRGRVSDFASGAAIRGVEVIAYRMSSNGWASWRQATTSVAGDYDISGLSPGTYRIKFRDPSNAYLTECYDDVTVSDVGSVGVVDLELGAGESRNGVDAALVSLAPDPYEPDNTRETAASLQVGSSQQHIITLGNKVDWMSFAAEPDVRYEVTVPYSEGLYDLRVDLFDQDGQPVGSGSRRAVYVSQGAGTIYAAVSTSGSLYGAYSVRLDATPVKRPVVTQVWPANGTVIQGAAQRLGAIVSADCLVTGVRFEASTDSGQSWTSLGAASSGSVPSFGLSSWTLDGWDTRTLSGGAVMIRAIAQDEVGLSSTGVPVVTYTVDNEPPARPDGLRATPRDLDILLEWNPVADTALAGYEVYRSPAAGGPEQLCSRVFSPHYADRNVKEGVGYRYVVRAVDAAGNVGPASEPTTAWPLVDMTVPTAAAGADRAILTGGGVLFDAAGSTDNRGITSYMWDFGDGATGYGFTASHSYVAPGEYLVVLTVKDAHGNTATDSAVVVVRDVEPDAAADLKVTVRKTDASALSGAQVVVEQSDGVRLSGVTNGSGQATFKVRPGAVIAYAFRDGMMPGKGTATLKPAQSGSISIELEDQDVILGSLTVEPMTLEDMVEAGIDISNPANYHTQSFKVEWGGTQFTGVVGKPVFIDLGDTTGIVGVSGPAPVGGGSTSGGGGGGSQGDPAWASTPRYAYVMVAGKAAWLREMFNVTLTLRNLAEDDAFHLVDTKATLNLEQGMSLAAMAGSGGQQTLTQSIADIGPGQQKALTWYVRGDEQGEYPISVDVETSLTPFSGRLLRHYATPEKVRVYGRGGVTTSLSYPSKVYKGHEFVVKATMRNMMPHDAYMVGATLDPPVGATLKRGAKNQTCEVLGPDESFEASWTLTALGTGPMTLEENEGSIAGWVRWSDLSGDEIIVPFLPEKESTVLPIEEGGKAHRYYRVIEPTSTMPALGPKGVWFMDGFAELDVKQEGEPVRTEVQTVTVDNRWPAGVFAVSADGLGTSGDEYRVDFKGFRGDGYDLDTSCVSGFTGRVIDAESTISEYKIGNEVMVSGKLLMLEAEQRIGADLVWRTFPESADPDAREVDLDIYSQSGIGPSVEAKFPLSVDSPVIQFDAGASAEAKVGTSLHLGVGSRYDNPTADERQRKAEAAATFDLLDAMGVGKPTIGDWGQKFAKESQAETYVKRISAGAGIWGSSEAKIGGSAGLGPNGVLGIELDLAEAKGDYEFDVTGSLYPRPSDSGPQVGLSVSDKASASGSLLSVTATNPWAGEDSAALFERSVDGATSVEAFFNISDIDDVVMGADAAYAIDRVEIVVDDEDDNMKRVFTLDGDTVRMLLQDPGLRDTDGEASLLAAVLTDSLSSQDGARGVETPPLPGVSGRLTAALIDHSDSVDIVSGPKPDSVSQDFAIGIDALNAIGFEAAYQFSLDARTAALTASGQVRNGIVYPLETHVEPEEGPDIPNYVQSILKVISFGSDYAQEKYAEKKQAKLDQEGGVVDGTSSSASAALAVAPSVQGRGSLSSAAAAVTSATPSPGSIRLVVPPGAVSSPTTFTVNSYFPSGSGEPTAVDPPMLDGISVLGAVHDVAPGELSAPATVTITFDASRYSAASQAGVSIWRFDTKDQRWVRLPSQVDADHGTVTANSAELGLLVAGVDSTGPDVKIMTPGMGQSIAVTRPWITFKVSDEASGIATDTLTVSVDGQDVMASRDDATGLFWSQSPFLAEGVHDLAIGVTDLNGVNTSASTTFTVDSVVPSTPGSLIADAVENGVRVSWSPSSESATYRVYRRSGDATQAVCCAVSSTTEFVDRYAPGGVPSEYRVTAVDDAGNESDPSSLAAATVLYTPRLSISGTPTAQGVRVTSQLTGSLGMPLLGQSYVVDAYSNGGQAVRVAEVTQTASPHEFLLAPASEVTTLVATYVGDRGYRGVETSVAVRTTCIDRTPPSTVASGMPSGWVRTPVDVELVASDDAGGSIQSSYRIGTGPTCAYSSPIRVTGEGETHISFWSVDEMGNVEEPAKSVTTRIDRSAPLTTSDAEKSYAGAATITLEAHDSYSGVSATHWRMDGGPWTAGTVVRSTALGRHVLEYYSQDAAGNRERRREVGFSIGRPTRLTLMPPSSTLGYGRAVNLYMRLVLDEDSPLPGRAVVLERLSGSEWLPVNLGLTRADGSVVIRTEPLCERQTLRARFATGTIDAGAVSETVSLTPPVRLVRLSEWDMLRTGGAYRATGYVEPGHDRDSSRVVIRAYRRRADGTYPSSPTTTFSAGSTYTAVTADKSLYSVPVLFGHGMKGTWRLVAFHAADERNAATSGREDIVVVK